MNTELLLRGYPSRIRFAEWQAANSLPEDKLPGLSPEQKARARALYISERDYRVALKAAQLASERATSKMEQVARLIAEAVKSRDPKAVLTSVVWDFYGHTFEYFTRHDGREYPHSIPTLIIDDVLLEKEGAEQRLKDAVNSELRNLGE